MSAVQSPDTGSSKSSPPLSTPRHTPTAMLDLPGGQTQSLSDRLNRSHTQSPVDGFGRVTQLPMPSQLGGGAAVAERVGDTGQNLVDVMSSKFITGPPPGLPIGNQAYSSGSEVKNVSFR